MNRKADALPSQHLVKQQSASPFQAGKPLSSHPSVSAASDAPNEPRNPTGANGGTYYDSTAGNPTSTYPPISYADQSGSAAPQPNGNSVGTAYDSADNGQYMYAPAAAVSTATIPNVNTVVDLPPQPPNPLIAFASQATQHVAGQTSEDWQPHPAQLLPHNTGNTWQDWTAAIADSQDRYSASALLTLGSSRPGDISASTDHVSQGGPVPGGNHHTGQWPLLLFHEGSGP